MHEFSLAEELVKVSSKEAGKAGIVRLDRIFLRIGALSGISIEALEFAFSFLKEEDELTKNAELVVERVPGKGRCKTCGKEINLDRLFLYCPDCGTPTVEIVEGREFLILSLEGEDESEAAAEEADSTKNAGGNDG